MLWAALSGATKGAILVLAAVALLRVLVAQTRQPLTAGAPMPSELAADPILKEDDIASAQAFMNMSTELAPQRSMMANLWGSPILRQSLETLLLDDLEDEADGSDDYTEVASELTRSVILMDKDMSKEQRRVAKRVSGLKQRLSALILAAYDEATVNVPKCGGKSDRSAAHPACGGKEEHPFTAIGLQRNNMPADPQPDTNPPANADEEEDKVVPRTKRNTAPEYQAAQHVFTAWQQRTQVWQRDWARLPEVQLLQVAAMRAVDNLLTSMNETAFFAGVAPSQWPKLRLWAEVQANCSTQVTGSAGKGAITGLIFLKEPPAAGKGLLQDLRGYTTPFDNDGAPLEAFEGGVVLFPPHMTRELLPTLGSSPRVLVNFLVEGDERTLLKFHTIRERSQLPVAKSMAPPLSVGNVASGGADETEEDEYDEDDEEEEPPKPRRGARVETSKPQTRTGNGKDAVAEEEEDDEEWEWVDEDEDDPNYEYEWADDEQG